MNPPLALTLRSSPPLSCSTTVPDSPETVPPMEYVDTAVHVTATLVMFADPTVPEPLATVQFGPAGWSSPSRCKPNPPPGRCRR